MYQLSNLKIKPCDNETAMLRKAICHKCKINDEELLHMVIVKKSLDARKRDDIHYLYKVAFSTKANLKKVRDVSLYNPIRYEIEEKKQTGRECIIAGSGPAGLFCAYRLALAGIKPIVFERGASMNERILAVEQFWATGKLDEHTNVQFGEGGAGTFSDGKLNTQVKDKFGRHQFVLDRFVDFGAPKDIAYINKPHIGTDELRHVVTNMRNKIIELGGEFKFNHCINDVIIKDGCIEKVVYTDEHQISHECECTQLVLAVGHSARDTFRMLFSHHVNMQQKSFAVGCRIEHPQKVINQAQYHGEQQWLPPADYKVTYQSQNGRSGYSFCMCPGGYVVNASSVNNHLTVNGMSYRNRAGENANSAIVVGVSADDFGSSDPLAGIHFQEKLEENAFQLGKGKIPVQRFEDFCMDRETNELGTVTPSIKGQYQLANLRHLFDEELSMTIEETIKSSGKKIAGFDMPDAVLSGVEARTSSPVRIVRDETMQSNIYGVYPCGEGAGYAGGIMSAAVDGLKVAEMIEKEN